MKLRTLSIIILMTALSSCGDDSSASDAGLLDGATRDIATFDGAAADGTLSDAGSGDGLTPDAGRDSGPDSGLVAELKAFPSAYGGGANATGGRGGNVYHVTNLEESSEGSFAWALGQPRPATIIFDVSGYIDSSAWIDIGGSDLTIAGQSAPVGGITLTSTTTGRVRVRENSADSPGNLIMRYIRVRPANESPDDAFELYTDYGYNTVIFDHMSISYGGDETISVRGVDTANITIQNTIVGEGKTGSLYGSSGSEERDYSSNFSYLRNLNYNVSHRSPNYNMNNRADVINNVVHQWQNGLGANFGSIQLNTVNNFFSLGGRTSLIGEGTEKSGYSADILVGQNPQIYTAGNISDKGFLTDPNADNSFLFWKWHTGEEGGYTGYHYREELLPAEYFVDTMYPQVGVAMPILSAVDARTSVLENAGTNASLNADGTVTRYTDMQDTAYLAIVGGAEGSFYPYVMYDLVRTWWEWNTPAIIAELNNKYSAYLIAGGFVDGSGDPDITQIMSPTLMYDDFVADVIAQGSTPMNTRPANFYVSSPHIPEVWFLANVPSGQNHNDIAPSGYTWLEEYLNQVDD